MASFGQINNVLVRWLSFAAGLNLALRGVGFALLPKLDIPVAVNAQEIWPFGSVSDDVTGFIWFAVGMFLIALAFVGDASPRLLRATGRWLGLWMYWNLQLLSIWNMVTANGRPLLWGAFTANMVITIVYTAAVIWYGIGQRDSAQTTSTAPST